MNNDFNVIPELNYWFKVALENSSVYNCYYDLPGKLSDHWRCKSSVIELLFNENFNPDPPTWLDPEHKSVVEFTNDRRYIYTYRRCNLLHIKDKDFLNRIQLYRWTVNTFAANSDKFLDEFNMRGSLYDHIQCTDTTLPYDVEESERSPYITYIGRVWFSTNYPLPYWGEGEIKPKPDEPIYLLDENILHLTEEDHIMLELLYDYKTGKNVNLCCVDYNSFFSPLAKLIYIYLEGMILHTITHYDIKQTIGITMLQQMYEKHVINMLYMLFQKLYGIDFEETFIVNGKLCKYEQDTLMTMKLINDTIIINDMIKDQNEISIRHDKLPHYRRDFTVFADGKCLIQDKDYTAIIDSSDIENPIIRIKFLNSELLQIGENIKLFWCYVDPYSAWSNENQEIP